VVQPFVVDTSILIQGYIEDVHTPQAQSLLYSALGAEPTPTLYVPEFCVLECTNILWKRALFHNKPTEEVTQTLLNLLAFPLVVHLLVDLLPRSLAGGIAHRLTICDAIRIALAEQLACPLITDDERQTNAALAVGLALKPITDFPAYTEQK
jgi:predicted nucleic acid-binding protein